MRLMPNHPLDKQTINPPYLLVTMAGRGQRFKDAGYTEPKPFIKVENQTLISKLLETFPQNWPTVFVVNSEDYKIEHKNYLKDIRRQSVVTEIKPNSDGPWETVMKGLESIPEDSPVFVTYCDYGQIWDAEDFLKFIQIKTDSDIGFVSYKGFHPHYLGPNMYCYLKTEGSKVTDIKEIECFSKNREDDFASTGGYYFKTARLLKLCLEQQKKQQLNWNGEYFTSLAIKALMNVQQNVKSDLKISNYEIETFLQWGTPEDLKAYQYWADYFRSKNQI